MPVYTVSYCNGDWTRHVAADGAVTMDGEAIERLMDEILVEPGSFVSVSDESGRMLQVVVADDGRMSLDFPAPQKRGSYTTTTSLDVCKRALRAMDGRMRPELVEGLGFERW